MTTEIKVVEESKEIEKINTNDSVNMTKNSFYEKNISKKKSVTQNTQTFKPSKNNNVNTSLYSNISNNQNQKKSSVVHKKNTIQGGRNENIPSDQYYKVKEENERLKTEQLKFNDKFKALQTQLYQMGEKMVKERYLGDKKVIYMDEGSEIEMMNIKNENLKLQEQLRKTKTVIKGMQSKDKVRNVSGKKVLINAKSMNEAVGYSYQLANKGDVVLLSPACASFDMFANFENRGLEFKKSVRSL